VVVMGGERMGIGVCGGGGGRREERGGQGNLE
jgi:hypothetical protein